jgi:2-methylisocitrate lyase-like PEP mutase family enzyme
MGVQAQNLRDQLNSGEEIVAVDCYSALTARIVELTGFKALYAGGHACGAFHYGVPDYGMYSQSEHVDVCARIARAVKIPLIADADTLGDTIAEAYHYTRRYEQAGVAGMHVEDEVNPRHSTYKNGLTPIPEQQFRLEAAARAREDKAFVIIARTDVYYWQSHQGVRPQAGGAMLEETLKRGKAYLEAGADSVMVPICPLEDHEVLVRELGNITVIGNTMPGTRINLQAGWGWMGAAQMHLERCLELKEKGKLDHINPVLPHKRELLEQDLYDDLIREWAQKTGRQAW